MKIVSDIMIKDSIILLLDIRFMAILMFAIHIKLIINLFLVLAFW